MRKLLVAIGALVVVLILAALIGPSLVDWSQYKSQLTDAARDATGRELSVDGAISLSLLPAPTLSVAKVTLANAPGGSAEPMATLDALDIRLALRPLLAGDIQVESLLLKRPRVLLERRTDGTGNWQFDAATQPQSRPKDGGTGADSAAAGGDDGLAQRVALDKARIEDGTLIYRDLETGAAYEITAVAGAFSLASLSGPYDLDVEGRLDDLPFSLGGRVEAMTDRETSRVALTLGIGKAEAKLSGQASLAGEAPAFDGTLAAQGPDLGAVMAALGGGAGHGVERLPFGMEGSLAASGRSVRYDQMKLQLGDSRFTGNVSAAFDPRTEFELALSATRVNLDDLLAASASMAPAETPSTATDAAPSGTSGTAAQAPDPQTAQPSEAGAFPSDLTASVDVQVETLVYRGKPARNLKANLLLSDGELTVNEASVGLPGDTNLSVFGFIAGGDGKAKFDGSAEISSSNVREALDWLGADLSGVPPDRMRRLEAKSAVVASRNEVLLNGLQVSLDTSRLTGSVRLVPGDRLGIGARLAIDKIDLDAYHGAAETTAAQKPGASAEPDRKDAKADAEKPDAKPPWHQRVDVNAIVEAQSIRLNQQAIGGVRLDGQLLDGTVTVRRLDVASLAGAKLNITDAVKALDGGPEFSLGGFSLSAQEPAGVLRTLGLAPDTLPENLGPLTASGSAKGSLANLELNSAIEGLGGRFTFSGKVVDGLSAKGKLELNVEGSYPDAAPLLAVFAPGMVPPDSIKDLALTGQLSGGYESLAVDLSTAGSLGELGIKGAVKEPVGALNLDLQVTMDGFRPQLLAPLAGEAVPADLIKGVGAISGTLRATGALDQVQFTNVDLNANAFGGTAGMSGSLSTAGSAPFDLKLTATLPEAKPLLEAALPGRQFPLLGAVQLSGKLQGIGEDMDLALSLDGGAGALTAEGSLKGGMGEAGQVDLRLQATDFQTALLRPFVASEAATRWLAQVRAVTGKGSAKGSIKSPVLEIDDLQMTALGGRLAARGKVTSADNLALGVQAQAVNGEALLRALQSDYWPREKLGQISLTAQVARSGGTTSISNAKGKIAFQDRGGRSYPTNFSGEFTMTTGGPRPKLSGKIDVDQLNVDAYLRGERRQGWREIWGARPRPAGWAGQQIAQSRRIHRRWSRNAFGLEFVRANDVDLVVTGKDLYYGGYRLSNAAGRLTATGAMVKFEQLVGRMFSGGKDRNVRLDATLDARSLPTLDLALQFSNFNLSQLAHQLAQQGQRMNGVVSGSLKLNSIGQNQAEMIANLSGGGTLGGEVVLRVSQQEMQQLEIAGQVSQGLGNKLDELLGGGQSGGGQAAAGAVIGQLLSKGGGAPPISAAQLEQFKVVIRRLANKPGRLDGRLSVNNGRVQLNPVTIIYPDANLRTTGPLDLPPYFMETRSEVVFAEAPNDVYLGVVFRGPMDRPQPVQIYPLRPVQPQQQPGTGQVQQPAQPTQPAQGGAPATNDPLQQQIQELFKNLKK